MKIRSLLVIAIPLLFPACASHKDVRPGVDGVNWVVLNTDDTEDGSRKAISEAENYCGESKKHPAFVDESKTYHGSLDEKTYNEAKGLSRAAQVVGGGLFAMGAGDGGTTRAGSVVGLGGAATDQALGKAYSVQMKFKCQ